MPDLGRSNPFHTVALRMAADKLYANFCPAGRILANKVLCSNKPSRPRMKRLLTIRPPFRRVFVWIKQEDGQVTIKNSAELTGINFLCDAVLLPSYGVLKKELTAKYPQFEQVIRPHWNFFVAVFYFYALQKKLLMLEEKEYVSLVKATMNYFKLQYPGFISALNALMMFSPIRENDEIHQGLWLAGNLLQKPQNRLNVGDLPMGCELAENIRKFAESIDLQVLMKFPCPQQ